MMVKENKTKPCYSPMNEKRECCRIESVINVDERGQMILPKEIREKANINAGEKLAIVSWEKEGKVCCISLIKVEDFSGMVKDFLGPMVKDIVKE